MKIEINRGIEIAGDCVWGSGVNVKKLLIKFIKFIIINLKFKWNFFNN